MKTGVIAALVVFVVDAAPRWVGACTPPPYNLPHDIDAAFADDTARRVRSRSPTCRSIAARAATTATAA